MSEISTTAVLQALSHHIGADNGVPVTTLAREALNHMLTTPADERAVRSAIVDLRRQGQHVCAHPSTGYFMAANEAELQRSCAYLFDRAMCSLEQVAAMRKVSLPDLRGQLRLPT